MILFSSSQAGERAGAEQDDRSGNDHMMPTGTPWKTDYSARSTEVGLTALPYMQVLLVYVVSRVVVGLGVAFGKVYVTLGNDTVLGGGSWYHRLLRWDSEWYKIIATEGYRYNGDPTQTQTVVFYPLLPWLSWATSKLFGMDVSDAMLLVSNLAAVVAILLLFKLVADEFGRPVAIWTVTLVSFFPSSVFFSAGYTEPVALMFMVAFFLAVRSKQFVIAAVFAGLAVAARSSGIALLPVLVWEFYSRSDRRVFYRYILPLCVIATSGLWIYMLFLGIKFGQPMAFAEAQSAFHASTTMSSRIVSALMLQPFLNADWTSFTPSGLDPWFTVIFAVFICLAHRVGVGIGMTIFSATVIALPYLTLSGGPAGFTSMARFNIVSFPLFLVAALLSSRWPQWIMTSVVGVLGALLFMYAALFSQWQWAG